MDKILVIKKLPRTDKSFWDLEYPWHNVDEDSEYWSTRFLRLDNVNAVIFLTDALVRLGYEVDNQIK